MRNYNKRPAINIRGTMLPGWKAILTMLGQRLKGNFVLAIDCYTGIDYETLHDRFNTIDHALFIDTRTLFKTEDEIRQMTHRILTDDVLFGFMTHLQLKDYFSQEKLAAARLNTKEAVGGVIILGPGAALIAEPSICIYADMPRWELQLRMRKSLVNGLGVDDAGEPFSIQYKRGIFNDWKILDRHKQTLFEKVDFWLDTVNTAEPRLIDRTTFLSGLQKAAHSPFRVVPFFDPAPWGGQWMKEVFELDTSVKNYGWCFDCVPEENSLLLNVGGVVYEMPSINLVYHQSTALLGEKVEARFGKEFPIRFDLLDTMGGGNLSLQVHPTTEFAKTNFGLPYTQDESYYLLDAGEDAVVYLGLKTGVDRLAMLSDLEEAAAGKGYVFDAEKYVNTIPAKKHDHFLIPAGTIHCSGKNSVVLEISATPFIYTFKLWDWNRLGLDGKPRPINIDRGREVLNWGRDTAYTDQKLVNKFTLVAEGEGWTEEKTGLHPNEFIETRRHTFTGTVIHETNGSVNVLNLVEGDEIIVESIDGSFEPLVIHYAETFIVPASVGRYSIRPHGNSTGKICKTIKAIVRTGN